MKKVWIWMRSNWKIVIAVFFWLSAIFFILNQKEIKISQKIESGSIITLVLVTILYGTQTQKLVEQEKISLKDQKKKRHAEFGKERLEDFYYPLRDDLSAMGIELAMQNINFEYFESRRGKIRDLYMDKIYMATDKFDRKLYELLLILLDIEKKIQINALEVEVKKEALDELEETKGLIYKEIFEIEKNIKSVFLYFIESKPKSKTTNKKKQKGGNKKMNKPQKIVIGITIMLIGCIFIMYITLTKPIMPTSVWGEPELAVSSLLVIILGIVLIAGGLVVLFSKTKR